MEVYRGGPPDRIELELEIWLADLQESKTIFKSFQEDWPTTTLPAFDATWCALQEGEEIGREIDLRIRKALFAEGRHIGLREVMFDLAREVGLDMDHITRYFNNGEARAAVLEERRRRGELYNVRGAPMIILRDGT